MKKEQIKLLFRSEGKSKRGSNDFFFPTPPPSPFSPSLENDIRKPNKSLDIFLHRHTENRKERKTTTERFGGIWEETGWIGRNEGLENGHEIGGR